MSKVLGVFLRLHYKSLMQENLTFPNLLREELNKRQQGNAQFSLRAFARTLDLSPSYLSKLMMGTRVPSSSTFLKVTTRLQVADNRLEQLSHQQANRGTNAKFEALQVDQFRLIADWHHFAILEAVTLSDFQSSFKWIAERFSISEERAKTAFERLIRMGLIKIDKGGKAIPLVNNHSNLSPAGFSSANTEHERQVLEGALSALGKIPIERRHQSSVTMAIPASRLVEAKEKIRKFRRDLMATLQRKGTRDSVYQLSISFYPIIRNQI